MSELPLILIADDDVALSRALQLRLKSCYEVHAASTVSQAKALAAKYEYAAVIVDLNFEGQELDGIHLIDHLSKERPGTFLIVLSGDTQVKRVVEALRRRLFEFIHKEGDFFGALATALGRAAQMASWRGSLAGKFLSESRVVADVLSKVERIVRLQPDAPIMILGETGSGKEFLAQYIAALTKKKLIAANMAAIPKETAESVLFGHERGAFTGAVTNKIGLIEAAGIGIFFLDEIGESSPAVQAKLLRVLQEKEVQPLGSTSTRKVKAQFIAATHRDLEKMVMEGTFRLDLLQRLGAFVLRLPPLRERPEDVLLYTNLFLEELAENAATRYSLSAEGAQALLAHSWPGNVRELRNVIQRIVVLSDRFVVDGEAVAEALGRQVSLPSVMNNVGVLENNVRRDALMKALGETSGNKRLAAKTLGISEATIYRWVQEFGLRSFVEGMRSGAAAPVEVGR